MTHAGVVVIGAGPAGLAMSACLKRASIEHVLLEREGAVACSWRRHYHRLHLHTSRGFSGLPFRPMPRNYPRYPSRKQVVEYLDAYVDAEGLEPRTGIEVTGIETENHSWRVFSNHGTYHGHSVVLASGVGSRPFSPEWCGLETFPGTVLHSSQYRNGAVFRDQDVLVVGFGNSGGEIALDLLEHGARPMISVRSPVNITPRDVLGIPILAISIPLAKLPPVMADVLSWPLLKAYYPSYARLGLRKAPVGPYRQIRDSGRIPLLDIGTVREIRQGNIGTAPDVREVRGTAVHFVNGEVRPFSAIVFATGYRASLPAGTPDAFEGVTAVNAPGLYRCGFNIAPTGMLREIGIEAMAIARSIGRDRLPKAQAD
jgi:hypothetical protein